MKRYLGYLWLRLYSYLRRRFRLCRTALRLEWRISDNPYYGYPRCNYSADYVECTGEWIRRVILFYRDNADIYFR